MDWVAMMGLPQVLGSAELMRSPGLHNLFGCRRVRGAGPPRTWRHSRPQTPHALPCGQVSAEESPRPPRKLRPKTKRRQERRARDGRGLKGAPTRQAPAGRAAGDHGAAVPAASAAPCGLPPRISHPAASTAARARARCARQLVEAVRWLHDLGIAHRDLSLENVLLVRSGGEDRGGGTARRTFSAHLRCCV